MNNYLRARRAEDPESGRGDEVAEDVDAFSSFSVFLFSFVRFSCSFRFPFV